MRMDASLSKGPLPLWNYDPLHPLDGSPTTAQQTRLDFPDILDRDLTTRIVHRTLEHGRQRIRWACDKCRSRKVKVGPILSYLVLLVSSLRRAAQCSGEQPSCTRCVASGVDCKYSKKGMRGSAKPKAKSTASAFKDRRPSPYSRSANSNEREGIPRDSTLLQPQLFLPSPFVDTPTRARRPMPLSSSGGFPSQYTRSEGDSPRSSCDSPFVVPPPFLPPGLRGCVYSNDAHHQASPRYEEACGYGKQLRHTLERRSPRDFDCIPIDPRLCADEVGTSGCRESALSKGVVGRGGPGVEGDEGGVSASASSESVDGESA
ncbi:hypothetical protein C8R47DRAFT_566540 [Mycena vitilis]|nr:hypothetical protein C8R47DRAFT_566540 [Mycena vitilis]